MGLSVLSCTHKEENPFQKEATYWFKTNSLFSGNCLFIFSNNVVVINEACKSFKVSDRILASFLGPIQSSAIYWQERACRLATQQNKGQVAILLILPPPAKSLKSAFLSQDCSQRVQLLKIGTALRNSSNIKLLAFISLKNSTIYDEQFDIGYLMYPIQCDIHTSQLVHEIICCLKLLLFYIS